MDNNENIQKENIEVKGSILKALGKAVITTLYFTFVLPWKLWKNAIDTVSNLNKTSDLFKNILKGELPLMNSYLVIANAFIVIIPIIVLIVGLLFSIVVSQDRWGGFNFVLFMTSFLSYVIYAYFAPIMAVLIKEALQLILNISKDISKIANK